LCTFKPHVTTCSYCSYLTQLMHHKLLCYFHLSAPLDTTDHYLTISGLHSSCRIYSTLFSHNSSQSVLVEFILSNSFTLSTGIPQRSVLGPVLYISPISSLIAAHNLQHQQYADDTQLFISVSPTDYTLSVARLEPCLTDIYCCAVTQRPLSESVNIIDNT